jgi:hypothetical protein
VNGDEDQLHLLYLFNIVIKITINFNFDFNSNFNSKHLVKNIKSLHRKVPISYSLNKSPWNDKDFMRFLVQLSCHLANHKFKIAFEGGANEYWHNII